MADAIVAKGLIKTYGTVKAVDGLDLNVPEGTVLGLLGPNGAGKTTTVRMLTTLVTPTAGEISVRGIDVLADPTSVRRVIGVSGQYAAVDEHLTGFENLEMVGRLYHLGKKRARARARELLERFDLTEAADRPSKTYSGGMRRRLDLAGALVAAPPILFLDEPTTGLDPRSRIGMWDVLGQLVREGTTLLLTTQYLEEADELAEDIIVIDHGRAIARGTPDRLKRQVGGERLEITLHSADDASAVVAAVATLGMGGHTVDEVSHKVVVPVAEGTDALFEAVRRLDAAGIRPADLGVHRPTLDDVFLQLTGHAAEDADEEVKR
ncbi:ATP-binding cassette domain-containing protein [Phytomonospora sp. NPDC050363]|uniref:ATP-binding cassette domain-containing protein n=1 Tax=Phytomonospora sp. NPDC050363 TaxID=3155642 RepID=UPI0033D7F8AB